jgi:hypothetical protein
MSITKEEARKLLQARSLRVTAPRLSVLCVLSEADNPLSYTEVLARLGERDWCSTTIYRNLVKLREAGVAKVVSRAEGIDRYAPGRKTMTIVTRISSAERAVVLRAFRLSSATRFRSVVRGRPRSSRPRCSCAVSAQTVFSHSCGFCVMKGVTMLWPGPS